MKSGRQQRPDGHSSSADSRDSFRHLSSRLSIEEIIWRVPGPNKRIHIQDDIQQHLSEVGELLSRDTHLHDMIVLRLGKTTIPTHSGAVLAHSALIYYRMNENKIQTWPIEIDLSDLKSRNLTVEGLQIAITFMSTGSISVEEGSLPHALIAANLLEVESLLKLICEQMANLASKSPRSACVMLEIAVQSLPRHSDYRSTVVDAVAQLFTTVQRDPLFLKLLPESVYALFAAPVFSMQEDLHTLKCLLRWFKANPQHIYAAPFLLDTLKFNHITSEERDECLRIADEVKGLRLMLECAFIDRNWQTLLVCIAVAALLDYS
uniref:BTB domain-containing protein n=1 Tax=Ascaris lumbricoides TaxID=6252 RepID=A0A0M3HTL1_ASCLU